MEQPRVAALSVEQPNKIPEDIFANADLALYYSKENGRNQLNVFNDLSKEELERMSMRTRRCS